MDTITPTWDMADRLRKARETAGLTQTEMAERLSVSRSTVVNYEQRHTRPLAAIRKAWADACGVSDEWLLTGTRPIGQYDGSSSTLDRMPPLRHLHLAA